MLRNLKIWVSNFCMLGKEILVDVARFVLDDPVLCALVGSVIVLWLFLR
jgi:hypothetical protein